MRNDDIFVLVKQAKSLVENQFYIRATGHVRSLMSAGDGTLKMILAYQMEISKIFKVLGKRLLFAEHFRPGSSKHKEHFELEVFPFREAQFEDLKKFFDSAIKIYRGEPDCRVNLMRFNGHDDLVLRQKGVSLQID